MKKLGVLSAVLLALASTAMAQNVTRYSEEYRQGFVTNCVNEGEARSYCECVVDELPKYISEAELAANEIRKATDHQQGKRWSESVVKLELKASVPCLIEERK